MIKNNFLSVLEFQLKLEITLDGKNDYLIMTDEYYSQMQRSIEVISSLKPDICIFPEMSYAEEFNNTFYNLSSDGKLIVFGSTYEDGKNITKVFQNGEINNVPKIYPCGSEPMIRNYVVPTTTEFIENHLKSHEFNVNGQKIYILNCLEYYKMAYIIARDEILSKELFGFIVPCSNSNPKVFIDESRAIHNHNENIYSFVANRIKKDGNLGYGKSYIFGPIQPHEKEWLEHEGIITENHNCSIITMDSSTPSYCYGEYIISPGFSRFGRSDLYINTPQNFIFEKLI